jgi:hemin uptake protein HemP
MIPFEFPGQAVLQNAAADAARPTGVIDSAALMSDSKLIHIQHRGQLYSLRETRLGKLILTK